MYASERTGPRAELLAVIRVDHELRALVGACAQLLHRLSDVTERDEVAKLHAARKDDDGKTLVLGHVGLPELLRAKTGLKEMLIVEDRVGDTGLREERGQVRFPDALGEPRPQRTLTEDRVHPVGERADLADAVAPRNSHQDRLVVAAGEKLDLPTADEVREIADDVGPIRLEPVEERAGKMEARFHLRMAVQRGDERRIRTLGHLLEH